MYTLFADTDCDVTPQMAEEYGFKLISMPYIVDGQEVYPYESWKTFDSHQYYQMLRRGNLPSTCAISPAKYMTYFEPSFAAGQDILYVHFSAAMSGTFNAMNIAYEELKKKYPERTLYTFDTKGITAGSLNLIMEIGAKYRAGASIQEIIDFGTKETLHFAVYFYADNLKFFAKSGRVPSITAAMGGIFGIRPIINMNEEGKMDSIGKAGGRLGALHKVLGYVEDLQDDIKGHRVIIAHTDCKFLADKMAEMLKRKFGSDLDIVYTIVNPTAGAHCGPDCVGVSFHAKRR
jgi:DegV family protein with EDD domain